MLQIGSLSILMDAIFGNMIYHQRRQLNTCGQSKTGWKIPVILTYGLPHASMPLMLGTQREQRPPRGYPPKGWHTPQAWGLSSMPDADSDFQKLLFLLIRKAILLLSAIWFDIYIHKHIYQHLYLYSDSTKLEILLPQRVTSWSTSFG